MTLQSSEHDPLAGVAVFVAVARAGSFTLAAERLGLTKSAVGKAIARLETRLSITLFRRTTRLTRLTADGEAYLVACSAALDEVTAAQAALSPDAPALRGRVHIDMPVAFGRRILLPVLTEIARAHPDLRLSLSFTDATTDLLHDDVDIAVRFGALPDSNNLIARRLVTQERVICASPAYLDSHGEPLTLADIPSHRCIVGTPKGPPLVWLVREKGADKRITPPASHQLSDGEAMVDAAVAGLGLLQLPIFMLRKPIERGLLRQILRDHTPAPVEIHLVWPGQAKLKPRVRYIADQLIRSAAKGAFD